MTPFSGRRTSARGHLAAPTVESMKRRAGLVGLGKSIDTIIFSEILEGALGYLRQADGVPSAKMTSWLSSLMWKYSSSYRRSAGSTTMVDPLIRLHTGRSIPASGEYITLMPSKVLPIGALAGRCDFDAVAAGQETVPKAYPAKQRRSLDHPEK